MDNNTITDHSASDTQNSTKDEAMNQFYFIITIAFIVLLVFLGFFIYNLIKCYLPKWTNKRELVRENDHNVNAGIERRIEFEEI